MSRARRTARCTAALVGALLLVVAGCTSTRTASSGELVIVVSTSLTKSPWLGRLTEQGARLAVEQVNAAGGVTHAGKKYSLKLDVVDHQNSPQSAQEQARRAAASGAVAFITDGVGAKAVAAITGPARVPTFVTFDGAQDLVDVNARPTLFRMAPANKNMCRRLADYLADRKPKVALLYDDTAYGQEGGANLSRALAQNAMQVTARIEVSGGGGDATTQVLRARRSGADTVIVWAGAATVASVVKAVRLGDWTADVWSGPTAEDPLVRQTLADHPDWVDGLGFVSFRITAEVGPVPYEAYRAAFEKRFGAEQVGVRAGGRDVVQPPDWSMYPYDAVKLVAASLAKATGRGQALIDALHRTTITGANGDERNFNPRNHEGVSADDMYFAKFRSMRFVPVQDDLLSKALPDVPQ
jgi:ABC-type branched-subunit amino acid transport system substrate-binding protein